MNSEKLKKLVVAEDGIVTVSFLEGHCGGEQTKCLRSLEGIIKSSVETMSATFTGITAVFDQRLTQGDKMFNEMKEDIKEHRKDMLEHKQKMEKQYNEFAKRIEKAVK